jgi:hypothetical protein
LDLEKDPEVIGKMPQLIGRHKVDSEFLTNLAVAWFAAGIISPTFSGPAGFSELPRSLVIGIIGAWFSLEGAVYWDRKGRK